MAVGAGNVVVVKGRGVVVGAIVVGALVIWHKKALPGMGR